MKRNFGCMNCFRHLWLLSTDLVLILVCDRRWVSITVIGSSVLTHFLCKIQLNCPFYWVHLKLLEEIARQFGYSAISGDSSMGLVCCSSCSSQKKKCMIDDDFCVYFTGTTCIVGRAVGLAFWYKVLEERHLILKSLSNSSFNYTIGPVKYITKNLCLLYQWAERGS